MSFFTNAHMQLFEAAKFVIEMTQVPDSIAWVCCASGNVFNWFLLLWSLLFLIFLAMTETMLPVLTPLRGIGSAQHGGRGLI